MKTEFAPERSLADTTILPSGSSWSRAIAERYRLNLSAELQDWFDSGICNRMGQTEFSEPASPEQLLSETPECIWPGLMPPDLLPLVSNGIGDWLCGRVSATGTIDEVVYWYHGGGDHLPYGKTLAAALLFDAVANRLPGRPQLHAVPADAPDKSAYTEGRATAGPLVDWAIHQLPVDVSVILGPTSLPLEIAAELIRHGIATDAVRCALVLDALDNTLRVQLTPSIAKENGWSWDREVAQWMFDTSLIPVEVKDALQQRWKTDEGCFAQDWSAVESHCQAIAAQRTDLAWVQHCLGWKAQRAGDTATAVKHYETAAGASVFTDQAIRFRTHFDGDRFGKFAIARLVELQQPHSVDPKYVDVIGRADEMNWRDQVNEYWLTRANQCTQASRAYELLYRAGWDVGCDSMRSYRDILDRLADAASDAGQLARAELARTHAACIDDRYPGRR